LATLNLPAAPLELLGAFSRVEGEYAAAPEFRVLNRSRRTVRHFEIGWVVRSSSGRSYSAAAVPPDQSPLLSGASTNTGSQATLRFPLEPNAQIGDMSAYLRRVEFEDGGFWIPARKSLEETALLESEPLTAEERRLSEIYRRQGLDAVIDALRD